VTRRPPHSPGRAVFPQPVPRLDSRPRKAGAHAYTLRRLGSVRRGRSMGTASRSWVTRVQLTRLRFPPRRLRHVHAPVMAQAQTRERAPAWPWTPESRSCPRSRALRPLQQAFPGPGRCACLPALLRWHARCRVLRAVRRLTRGTPGRSSVPNQAQPPQVHRRGRPGGTRLQRTRRVFAGAPSRVHVPRRVGRAWDHQSASLRHRTAQTRASA
jgi:hypothetical protein